MQFAKGQRSSHRYVATAPSSCGPYARIRMCILSLAAVGCALASESLCVFPQAKTERRLRRLFLLLALQVSPGSISPLNHKLNECLMHVPACVSLCIAGCSRHWIC